MVADSTFTDSPSPTPESSRAPIATHVIFVLAMLGGFGPFAIDTYLPGMPGIADEFGASATLTQFTLTGFMLSLGLCQLVIGPQSDQLGRRRLLLIGVGGSALASVLCALAPSIWILILGRVLQGALGAAGVVLSRAIIVDLGKGVGIAKAFATLMAVQTLAPVLAPIAGGIIVPTFGWRASFWFLAALSSVLFIATFSLIKESLPPAERTSGGAPNALRSMAGLLRSAVYVAPLAAFVSTFGVLFAYISASPFVLQRIGGLSEGQYSVVFTVNSLALLAGSVASGRIVGCFGPLRIALVAAVPFSGAVLFTSFAVFAWGAPAWAMIAGFFVIAGANGMLMPNLASIVMTSAGTSSGSGSALMGAAQFSLAAAIAPLTGLAGEASAVPMAALMLIMLTIQLGCLFVVRRVHVDEKKEPSAVMGDD